MDLSIMMVGSHVEGFKLVGPYASWETIDEDGDWAIKTYGLHDWGYWSPELRAPDEGADPAGTAVVFDGDITKAWVFYGPFRDLAAARTWAESKGLGLSCAIELQPVRKLAAA
jgi:hypothetical protein